MITSREKEFLNIFYKKHHKKVIYNKKQRDLLWNKVIKKEFDIRKNFESFMSETPALYDEICKSCDTGNNMQSAVLSECVYAQTLANILGLHNYENCLKQRVHIEPDVKKVLELLNIFPRYMYSSENDSKYLFQAGGCSGVDCVLIDKFSFQYYLIEFKEPSAKTSEPDLPKYKEDGKILITEQWLSEYPQFKEMLSEQTDLNFFEVMGSNINDFSQDSIERAVSGNYKIGPKKADLIITEDATGFLTAIPVSEIKLWAKMEGEIRPAGRNHYQTWTPLALIGFLTELGANISGDTVYVDKDKLKPRKQRGNPNVVSGYKINSLFFVRKEKCTENNGILSFNLSEIRQLNPTIAGKMFFVDLDYQKVKRSYFSELKTVLK